MSYIRGALPFLIYNPNTRDDIVPNGTSASFELSQEVPGGYEGNVQVIRRELKSDILVQSCVSISFDSALSQINCNVAAIAAALSTINVGEIIRVQGASNSSNNDDLLVSAVVYDGQTISITVDGSLTSEVAGASITLTRRFAGPWEVLEPEVDYAIGGSGDQINRVITFSKIPQETDVIYVVHRGEATYNFVPTEKSVGPEQLQENLRNFKVDIFDGDGSTTVFELSQLAVNARALEVSVNGVIKYGDDPSLSFVGDFELINDGSEIEFASAPANGAKIHVRHLGFSTISRRQTLSPTQAGNLAPGSVGTLELANNSVTSSKLSTDAVTNTKIQNNAVNGAKILLDNNESLNWKSATSPFGAVSVLRLGADNNATLRGAGGVVNINLADTKTIRFSTTEIRDASASGQVDLGSNSNRFKDAYLSGQVSSGSSSVSGNATIGGNLTVTGTVNSVDVSNLQAQVNALAALVAQNTPAGTIKLWARDTGAPSGYLLCNGASYSTAIYPDLFSAIGYTFGGSGANFNVPDFRGRFPLGKAASGTGSGWGTGPTARNGSLDHTHTTPSHTHGLANHVHSIPSHYHGMIFGNSTLRISQSSGNHDTSISHDHAAFNTADGGSHTHIVSTGVGEIKALADGSGHAHTIAAFSTASTSLWHYHTGTTDTMGAHNHTITSMSDSPNFGKVAALARTRAGGTVDSVPTNYNVVTGSAPAEGAHNHNFTTSSPKINVPANVFNPVDTDLTHSHNIPQHDTISNGGTHSHNISGTIQSTLGTLHSHNIDIPAFTGNSSSNGLHTHPASSFEGAIGNVSSGADGNTGFNSGPPSPNSTDLGGESTTGGENPAFQTINFIIKT